MKYPVLIFLLAMACCKDAAYMRTGFYFLGTSKDGVRMKKEHSGEYYYISRVPFASVDNIKREYKEQQPDSTATVCMEFDDKGTSAIKNGTGDLLQPIAVIIGNKLLYVVDNTAKIETGVMCVLLVGYTDRQIDQMQREIEEKK